MRKLLSLLILILGLSQLGHTQYNIDYGFSVGASSFLGDLGGGPGNAGEGLKDFDLSTTRWTLGGFYRYRFSPLFAFKGALQYIRLRGDDDATTNIARRSQKE